MQTQDGADIFLALGIDQMLLIVSLAQEGQRTRSQPREGSIT